MALATVPANSSADVLRMALVALVGRSDAVLKFGGSEDTGDAFLLA
jgi:hypothetical protein